jgi:hypothetical protein
LEIKKQLLLMQCYAHSKCLHRKLVTVQVLHNTEQVQERIVKRVPWVPDAERASPADVDWTVTVIEPLPNCPSVEAGWQRIATQTKWAEWRSKSKMRGKDVTTTVVPPAIEPLRTGDEYIVKVGRFLSIYCRVLESSSLGTGTAKDGEMVFDAMGVALGGIVNARFRFTVFRGDDGVVMARAQEKIMSLPLITPSKRTLESEHRHTFKDLNNSFRSSPR